MATTTHIALFVILIESLGIGSAGANVLAYLAACVVGFAGHSAWTFRMRGGTVRRSTAAIFAKFVLASLYGLGLNALVVYIVAQLLGASYLFAIPFMATIVPLAVFLINRSWVFFDSPAVKPRGPHK